MRKVLTSICLFLTVAVQAQHPIRCATMEDDSIRRLQPGSESMADFENWLQAKIVKFKTDQSSRSSRAVVTIPIIFHVIHNGSAPGVNENISQAQVMSQIDVLNEDYRRKAGTPGFNSNAVGADVEIEFCPALVDPNGNVLAEPGIDRVNMGQASWTQAQCNSTLKPQTYWNPDLYCNVWTVNFGGSSSSLLGFAQFPNSTLAGIGTNNGGASTDGVVIRYNACGRVGNLDATYNGGRTLTHELGHYLGLRHIWGDGNSCTATDYCDDTPKSTQANYGCPTLNSCNDGTPDPNDMVQNYMDYTDDGCMNIFTNDQKTRILTIINNAPRRVTLLSSDVCSLPVTFLFTGQVRDAANNQGVANAKVLLDGNTDYTVTTDTAGNFSANIKAGTYTIYAGKWGYVTNATGSLSLSNTSPAATVLISKGYYDDFLFDFGWTQTGTATTGKWVRGVPAGTTYTSGVTSLQANPGADVTGDFGTQCMVTGNGGGTASNDDVDNGTTIITSPVMALAAYTNPKLSYYRWFFNNGGNGTADDSLVISINNGTQAVVVDKIAATTNAQSQWLYKSYSLNGVIPLTNTMRLVVRTFDNGGGNLVEAGFDFFKLIDSVPPVPMPPIANFSASNNAICAGASVTFNDLSTNLPTNWHWNFTGGVPDTANTPNPSVVYNAPGTYPVSLTVSNNLGNDSKTINGFITVNAVVADFSSNKISVCPNDTVAFTSASACNPTTFNWRFDGGSPATANGANPLVTYSTPGLYDVQLIAANNFGADTLIKGLDIQVYALANISASTTPDLNNTSSGSVSVVATGGQAPYTYQWSSGTSTSASLQQVPAGDYSVTVTDAHGCKVVQQTTVNSVLNGITEPTEILVRIEPNPSSGLFRVATEGAKVTTLQVLDATGRIVLEQPATNPLLDVRQQPQGVYMLRITTSEHVQLVRKLVKEN
ncbi:MAG: PKD domain-containing protein [Chitinophagales bacterium]